MYTCLQEKFRMTHSKRKKKSLSVSNFSHLGSCIFYLLNGKFIYIYIYEAFDISLMFSLNKDNE